MLTCSMMRFLSLLRLGLCDYVVLVVLGSVCEVVVVPYVVSVVTDACIVVCVTCVCAVRV